MASNDIEVLDPAATVEKLKKITSGVALNRRQFMGALGVAGVAAGTGLVSSSVAHAQQPVPDGYQQVDVLNYLLNIKYLTATFYSYVTQGADLPGSTYATLGTGAVYNTVTNVFVPGSSAYSQQQADLFNEMYYDELNQVIDLRNLITGSLTLETSPVISRPTMSLGGQATTTAAQTATFSAITTKSSATLTSVSSVSSAAIGQTITGTGIPANTVITAVGTNTVTISNPATATVTATETVTIQTVTPAQVIAQARMLEDTCVTAFAGAVQYLSGANLAFVTQALAISGQHASALRLLAIQSNGSVGYQRTQISSTTQIGTASGSASVFTIGTLSANIFVGANILGTGIPTGATITALTSKSAATFSAITTNASPTLSAVSSVALAAVGQPITGTGIPANTAILAVGTTTITMTNNATATITTAETVTNGQSVIAISVPATATVSSTGTFVLPDAFDVAPADPAVIPATITANNANVTVQSLTGLAAGQVVAGTGIAAGTKITAPLNSTSATAPPYTIVFSAAPTAAGTSFYVPALATAGPGTSPSLTPVVNQGFFNTAGASSSNGANPPGFAFARTFSQVLAVLYANSTPATNKGGFFSVGVGGKINEV